MEYFNTVLGRQSIDKLGKTLPHEHICCYYEPFYNIADNEHMDKAEVVRLSAAYLKHLKETYGLTTFVDGTPINTGRDLNLLREISRLSGVNIVASSGLYYQYEPMLNLKSEQYLCDMIVRDCEQSCIGMLKLGLDSQKPDSYIQKVFKAVCMAQKKLNIPIYIHTNAFIQNGIAAADFVLECGVAPSAVTIGHCSDSDDNEYIYEILKKGCYIGYDRLYPQGGETFLPRKAAQLAELCKMGYGNKVLISQDTLVYNEYCPVSYIQQTNPYEHLFTNVIPCMENTGITKQQLHQIMVENTANMFMMI
ncbi:MAG: hypothetical protein IJ460_08065 [Clostridia bacterium]|nr:hypothetical protein [Clostridia bacterium]